MNTFKEAATIPKLKLFNRKFRFKFMTIVLALLMLLPMLSFAQATTVYGVFFYSPSCPHCHDVIDNHWPGIQEEFGNQLKVLFIDVSKAEGSQVMRSAINAMEIPSTGVPMLILGDNVLIGSIDIPQRAPEIIRTGLATGGIGYPPIPDIDILFDYALMNEVQNTETATAEAIPNVGTDLMSDPANLLAIVVLFGLIGNLVLAIITLRNRQNDRALEPALPVRLFMIIGTIIGVILAGSLLIGSLDNLVTLVLSATVLGIFLFSAYTLFVKSSVESGKWLIPLINIAGLLVAGYLAYVELTLSEATCGLVGNCNIVQQSPYAQILGIPIGVIGILGYIAMLGIWLFSPYKDKQHTLWLLFAMAVIGTIFSTYLTFLEPFVIGSTCVWCLTSAVIMTLLLWLYLPIQPEFESVPIKKS